MSTVNDLPLWTRYTTRNARQRTNSNEHRLFRTKFPKYVVPGDLSQYIQDITGSIISLYKVLEL